MTSKPPHIKELMACLQCAYCGPVCPTMAEVGWESRSPRGILFALKRLAFKSRFDRLLDWDVKPDEKLVKRLYQCTQCGLCAKVCHVNIDLPSLYDDIKAWLVDGGLPPPAPHRKMAEAVSKHRNYYAAPAASRHEWLGTRPMPKKADVIFFVGCTMSYELLNLARSTVKLMTAGGVDFTIMGAEEWCCGHPLLLTGQTAEFRKTATHNIETIMATQATRVVTGCPGCYLTLKKTYPEKVGKLGADVLHTSELLAELVDRGKLKFTKRLDGGVLYHDPCTLGRRGGVFEAPRKLVESIPGAGKILEFDDNRGSSVCCGGGGMLRAFEDDMAVRIATRRIQAVGDIEAATLASACPACRINLMDGMHHTGPGKAGKRPAVRDIVELAVRAL
jgi:heterodisulfide reductase subunit D